MRVRDGVVLLEGSCARRSRIPMLVRAVAGVEGVVRVENRVDLDLDDGSLLPSTARRPQPPPAARTERQAIELLDLTAAPFVFFTDPASGRGAVVYRRSDGHYGLLTPAV